jgi:hypothetical protein
MIMGRNGPHLAKMAHDHGRRPECRNVTLRPQRFHVIVGRCLVLSGAAVRDHAAAAALCVRAVPPPARLVPAAALVTGVTGEPQLR